MLNHSIDLYRVFTWSSIILMILFLSSCSRFKLEPDKEESNSLNDVVFTTAFCVTEKSTLRQDYFRWKDCYTTKLSKQACSDLEERWYESSDTYVDCRDQYLSENLMINPFHIYRK